MFYGLYHCWKMGLLETVSIFAPDYTFEDYLTNMLADEINREINEQVLSDILKSRNQI